MTHTTPEGYTIYYPDIAFAFNPIPIHIANYTSPSPLRIEAQGIVLHTEALTASTSIYFDLAAIAQSLFDRFLFHHIEPLDNTLYKALHISISNTQQTLLTASIPIVWGALQPAQAYTPCVGMCYFKGLPFTLPLLLTAPHTLLASPDKQAFTPFATLPPGKHNLHIDSIAQHAHDSLHFATATKTPYLIFDATFAAPFCIPPQQPIHIHLAIQECNEGVYLRWINTQGEYNYYLFDALDHTATSQHLTSPLGGNYTTTARTHNYHQGTGRTRGKQCVQTQKLRAALVSQDTYTLLLGATTSPIIDLHLGNNQWIAIAVEQATHTRTSDVLQDFDLSIRTLCPPPRYFFVA